MTAADQLLRAFDDALGHRWESLAAVCEVLTEAEAAFRHPAWADASDVPELPPPGTILWQLAHLEHCARHYTAILRNRPEKEPPETRPSNLRTLKELLPALERAHGQLREVIAGLTDTDLPQPTGRDNDVAEFIRMLTRHASWHASQIALIRRLWRERGE
jgi:hypothetical protein